MYGGYYYTRDTVSPQVGPTTAPYTQQMPQTPSVVNINAAYAMIVAGPDYPSITGIVTFFDVPGGVRICADIANLPAYLPATGQKQPIGPFGFHIHENGNCTIGNPAKPFEASGGHWNPTNQPHGNHVGDFPVLIASNGRAIMCFITDRFRVVDVLGKAVVIHENPDDYRTQPAGNSGKRIACGVIQPQSAFQPGMQGFHRYMQ